MREASKTRAVRPPDFSATYLAGAVLDIGSGDDPVVPHAVPFDRAHGDANRADEYFPAESFDCVHSSHCLEHMANPEDAIRRWWRLVRPGGFLIVVVPHEDLYEQGYWPSRFNPEHIATFRTTKQTRWSPVSRDLRSLVTALPAAKLVALTEQADGYIRQRALLPVRVPDALIAFANRARRAFREGTLADRAYVRTCRACNIPIDQTRGRALAQIEAIVQKC